MHSSLKMPRRNTPLPLKAVLLLSLRVVGLPLPHEDLCHYAEDMIVNNLTCKP